MILYFNQGKIPLDPPLPKGEEWVALCLSTPLCKGGQGGFLPASPEQIPICFFFKMILKDHPFKDEP